MTADLHTDLIEYRTRADGSVSAGWRRVRTADLGRLHEHLVAEGVRARQHTAGTTRHAEIGAWLARLNDVSQVPGPGVYPLDNGEAIVLERATIENINTLRARAAHARQLNGATSTSTAAPAGKVTQSALSAKLAKLREVLA